MKSETMWSLIALFAALLIVGLALAVGAGTEAAIKAGTERVTSCIQAGGSWVENQSGSSCTAK